MNKIEINLTVNGNRQRANVEPRLLLSDFIRDELGLKGTHVGCSHGVCGVCTVSMDGQTVRSCLTLAAQADGASIETIEHLGNATELHPIQQAFSEAQGLQCGYCTPGMIAITREFLQHNPTPTREEATEAVSGALCRCTGYEAIVDAVLLAAELIANTPIRTEEPADE